MYGTWPNWTVGATSPQRFPLAPVLVTPPTNKPLELAEVKTHLRAQTNEDEDELIKALIDAAISHLDGWSGILGRALITQTWRQSFRDFCWWSDYLRLPLAPVQSVTVKYYDSANVQQTWSASNYSLVTDNLGPLLQFATGVSPPSVYDRIDGVQVDYVVGYGDTSDTVPRAIRQAMLLMIGSWFQNRENEVQAAAVAPLPLAADALLTPFRRVRF